jgi:uncharacterized repeat protein (TIGR01451 family)
MKPKYAYVLVCLIILIGWCGVGALTGTAQGAANQPDADLPPRPTPGLTLDTPKPAGTKTADLDIKVSISAYPTEVEIGDRVVFTIHLSNPGKQKIGGIYVSGLIPDVFDFQDLKTTLGTASFNPGANRAKVFIKPLLPGAEATITYTVTVSKRAVIGETYSAAAQVSTGKAESPTIFSNWVKSHVVDE